MKAKFLICLIWGGLVIHLILFSTSVYPGNAQEQQLLQSFSTERIDVPISNLTVGWTDSRNIVVSGIVINNSTYPLNDIIVDASLFDKNNELINKESRFVIPPSRILEPGSSLDFRFFIIAEGAYNYNISAFGIKGS